MTRSPSPSIFIASFDVGAVTKNFGLKEHAFSKHLYAKYNLEGKVNTEEVVVAEDSEDDDELFGTTVKSGNTFTGAAAE